MATSSVLRWLIDPSNMGGFCVTIIPLSQGILSRIASDGQVHVVGDNGGALRDFLAAVGATMVSTIKAAI